MSTLKLTVVGDVAPLRSATKKAEASLRKLTGTAAKTGNALNKSLGAVGLGVGLATLTNGLKNATRAASDDRKSQGLLANALKNTVGATSSAIAGAEQYIKKTQLSSAVLDDELRPALANAVRATGSLAGGQRLLDLALDISASTGKDLSSVTGGLSKAYAGNTGALKRLVPGIKLTDNWMGELETKFAGASELAANLDPYKRLEVMFADIQETVGEALLPSLEKFSEYLASPEGQQNVEDIVQAFVEMGKAIGNVITFLIQNADAVLALVKTLVFLKVAWWATTGAVKLYYLATNNAIKATKLLKTAMISTGIGALIVLVGELAAAWQGADNAQDEYNNNDLGADFDPADNEKYLKWIEKNKENLIPDWNIDAWLALGYESYGAYTRALYDAFKKRYKEKKKIAAAAAEVADEVRKALNSKIEAIKKTGEKFRDAVGIAFGVFGEDEYSVFNEDVLIGKLKRMVAAAKGFAENIKKLRTQGADESFINEIVGMGPAQGNIVAQGLLSGGNLKEILGLRKSLYGTGTQVGAQQAIAGNATYEININKAVISASDIIREIRLLEKKTGRKYLVG